MSPLANLRQHHANEQLIHLSPAWRFEIEKHPVLGELFAVYAGYFPEAAGHRVDRPKGYDSHQIGLCLAGEGELKIAGKKWPIQSNDIFIARANEKYFYQSSDKKPWTLLWVHFSGSSAEALFDWIGLKNQEPIFHLTPTLALRLAEILKNLLRQMKEAQSPSGSLSSSLTLRQFFYELHQGKSPGETTTGLVTLINQKLSPEQLQKLNPKQLAKLLGYSESRFRTKFKIETGLSPGTWLMNMRLERAKYFLLAENLSVSKAAQKVGFKDSFHFSKNYKKLFGHPPSKTKIS